MLKGSNIMNKYQKSVFFIILGCLIYIGLSIYIEQIGFLY